MSHDVHRPSSSRSSAVNRSVACLKCRRNRQYCTKEKPRCFTCRKGDHECVYSDGRRISVLASHVYNLESRVKYYEHLLKTNPNVAQNRESGSTPEISSTFDDQETINEDTPAVSHEEIDLEIQPLSEGLENIVLSPSGSHRYLGASSSPILARRLREAVGMTASSESVLHVDQEASIYNADAFRLRRQSSANERVSLPPYGVAQRYFTAQYTMIGTIFSFVRPDLFEERLQQAYLGPPSRDDHDDCLSYCQVLLVMAFGQCYAVNQYTSSEGPPGFVYFTEALHFLPEIHDEPSVLFCGVLALTGYFMQNLNRRDAAFLYLGLAQRMAISLALHEEVSVPGLDEATKEQRRRTWWSIYSLDRILCVKYGNPVTMRDDDITVALPSRLPHEPPYCAAIVLKHYTHLSRILGQVMTQIYSKPPKSGPQLLQTITALMKTLEAWEAEIPIQLHYTTNPNRESISTFLHYHQCINMAARPLLFHAVKTRLAAAPILRRQTPWKENLNPEIANVIDRCIRAARESVAMMVRASEKNLVAVFGYMDGEHVFSAALVLVMVCVAFPDDEGWRGSMKDALGLLEMMAERGNFHIEARLGLLMQVLRAAGDNVDEETQEDNGTNTAGIAERERGPVAAESITLPAMDTEALEQIFATGSGSGDLAMFDGTYLGAEMNFGMDPAFWSIDTFVST